MAVGQYNINNEVLTDHQITCKFYFEVRDLFNPIYSTPDNFKFKVVSINLPLPSVETEKKPNNVHLPIKYNSPEEITLTILEDVNFDVYDYFNKWFNLVYDKDSKRFLFRTGYKRNGLIHFLDNTSSFMNLFSSLLPFTLDGIGDLTTFKLNGLMVKSIQIPDLSQENTTPLTYTINMSVDDIELSKLIPF